MAATKQIDAMTAAAALGGTEEIPGVQTAATVKITAAQIKTFTSASPTLVTPVLGVATGTSLALGGATIGSNALAVTGTAAFSSSVSADTLQIANTVRADGGFNFWNDVFWRRGGAAATFQHGAADAASPVAQTIKFQDVVAGTSNTAGVNATIQAPAGTGTGAGGSLIFQVAAAGSSGSAKNAWATALTIASDGVATFEQSVTVSRGVQIGPSHTLGWASGFYFFGNATTGAATGTGRIVGNTATALNFGGDTSSFPTARRNGTTLQIKLADDSAFTAIQGKLTTDTAYTAGDPTTTGYLVVYDSTGTAYRVPALLN